MTMSIRKGEKGAAELTWDEGGVLRFASRSFETVLQLDLTDRRTLAQTIWGDSRFRDAVFLASRGLHERVEACGGGSAVDEETAAAVIRYYLRSCFRPTPYGGFAGVSYVSVEASARTEVTIPEQGVQTLRFGLSGEFMQSIADYVRRTAVKSGLLMHLNDTVSRTQDVYRFIAGFSGRDKVRRYRSVEIERSKGLDELVSFVSSGKSYGALVEYLTKGEGATVDEAVVLVDQLIDEQLICTDGLCDLTARDPLASLLAQCPENGTLRSDLERITDAIASDDGVQSKVRSLEAIADDLSVEKPRLGMLRADLVDSRESCGAIALSELTPLKEAIVQLAEHQGRVGEMSTFVKNFESRFGDTKVPLPDLLQDLPFLGFGGKEVTPPLVAGLSRRKIKGRKISPVIQAAFQAVMKDTGLYVDFTKHLPSVDSGHSSEDHPPLVAWVCFWQEAGSDNFRIELKSLGRQDPGRVMGRFADSLPRLASYLRKDASELEISGLEVVEIVHSTSDSSANIVSRPELAGSELRIRGGNPPCKTSKQLRLDDLCVSIVRGRVVITLAADGKEVALRMSNAHAFIRSYGLPVYKFLNSVSNQSSIVDIPSLRNFLPTQVFAPGLVYKDIIISRPTWRPSDAFWKKLGKERGPTAIKCLREEFDLYGLPKWITVVQRDNIIPFDTTIDWMMEEVLRLLRSSDDALISDMLPKEMRPGLHSKSGYHFHEVQIAIRNACAPGQTRSGPRPVSLFNEEVLVAPGAGWTFLKIYCPVSQQDMVIREVFSLIWSMSAASCNEAFYVRYSDQTGPHIRLRVRSDLDVSGPGIEKSVLERVSQLWRQGAIGTYAISPYSREAARYGGVQACKICEEIFCADSNIAARQLGTKNEKSHAFWIGVARNIDAYLFGTGLTSIVERLDFATRAARDFSSEHGFGLAENRWIGKLHRNSRDLLRDFSQLTELDDGHPYAWLPGLWEKFVASAEVGTPIYPVRWSLIHMHMNRLFSKERRLQEAVIWELLKRSYVTIAKSQTSNHGIL